MTDFVKVKFMYDDREIITYKAALSLRAIDGDCYAYILNELVFDVMNTIEEESAPGNHWYRITREEYDRLCKELGVE